MTKHRNIFVFIFIYFTLLSGVVQAKTGDGVTKQEQAKIDGFRSAKFGVRERDVMKAIYRDFKINKKKVSRVEHPIEKTVSLGVNVEKLLPNSGPAKDFLYLVIKPNA